MSPRVVARKPADRAFDVRDELAAAVSLQESGPLLARVFDEVEGKVIRKARLPRTRYALHFTVHEDLVTVHALRHASRGSRPAL